MEHAAGSGRRRRPQRRLKADRRRRADSDGGGQGRARLEDEPLDPPGRRRVSAPLLDRDGAAKPDLVTVPEPVTVAERRRMIAEVLKVLPRRYPAAAHLGVAQPRQQLAENRRQDETEEAADLEISVLVEIADVNDPLA